MRALLEGCFFGLVVREELFATDEAWRRKDRMTMRAVKLRREQR